MSAETRTVAEAIRPWIVDPRRAVLDGIAAAANDVARIEAELADAHAARDALIRTARRDARCTIGEIQAASALTRSRVNQILAR